MNKINVLPANTKVSTSALISLSDMPWPFSSLAVKRISRKSRWRFLSWEGSSAYLYENAVMKHYRTHIVLVQFVLKTHVIHTLSKQIPNGQSILVTDNAMSCAVTH